MCRATSNRVDDGGPDKKSPKICLDFDSSLLNELQLSLRFPAFAHFIQDHFQSTQVRVNRSILSTLHPIPTLRTFMLFRSRRDKKNTGSYRPKHFAFGYMVAAASNVLGVYCGASMSIDAGTFRKHLMFQVFQGRCHTHRRLQIV
jgi:hypothetical protein